MSKKPILIIHGGARGSRPTKEMAPVFREAMVAIASEAYKVLQKRGSAVEAAVHATQLLEDNPIFNAGLGSKIQSDGKIRMSASLMDGSSLRFSGVVNIQNLRNPIALAAKLNEADSRNLSDQGAALQAKKWKLPFRSPYTKGRIAEFKAAKNGKTGTVGAVALDAKGRLAAATSTGGRGMELPGRVSDTPTVAGNYANSWVGISATGTGEQVVDFALCAKVATRVEDGLNVKMAMQKSFREAKKCKYHFGAIALGKDGTHAALTTTPFMLWAVCDGKTVKVSI